MLSKFIDKAIIIDDVESEADAIKGCLEKHEIYVTHFTPEALDKREEKFKEHNILFLDLHLDNSRDIAIHISRIRGYLEKFIGNDFCSYGIVLWTKHTEDIDEFKTKLALSENQFTKPLFIVNLNKTLYLQGDKTTLFDDIYSKLKEDRAALFAIIWLSFLYTCKDKTINKLYGCFFQDYRDRNNKFEQDIYMIAKAYAGFANNDTFAKYGEKHIELIKMFNDMLSYEIHDNISTGQLNALKDIFDCCKNASISVSAAPLINEALHIRYYDNIPDVLPGNVYCVENIECNKELPMEVKIEFTPSCDFANNKNRSFRTLNGFIIREGTVSNFLKSKFNIQQEGPSWYCELKNLNICLGKKQCFLVDIIIDLADFSSMEKDDFNKMKFLFRLNHNCVSDIQQKFASHSSRVGITCIPKAFK